jgi:hemolysin activation/secretion protein
MSTGTIAVTRDTNGAIAGLPLATSTSLSFTGGHVDFPDATQSAANKAGVNTIGDFGKVNLSFTATLGLMDRLALSTYFRGQKAFNKNLDSSEQIALTGYWAVRSFDEGLAGDSGYVVTPELKYGLPDIQAYRHSIGVFTDVGAVWLSDPSYTTTQQARTQLSDYGFGYYATYEYMAGRFLLLRAQIAQTYGSNDGAQSYDKRTKALVQIGFTF